MSIIFSKLIAVEKISDAYQFGFQVRQKLLCRWRIKSRFGAQMFAGTINGEFLFMEQMLYFQNDGHVFWRVRPLPRARSAGFYFFKFSFPKS